MVLQALQTKCEENNLLPDFQFNKEGKCTSQYIGNFTWPRKLLVNYKNRKDNEEEEVEDKI